MPKKKSKYDTLHELWILYASYKYDILHELYKIIYVKWVINMALYTSYKHGTVYKL